MGQAGRMRWWGWGDPAHPPVLPAHARPFLAEIVGPLKQPQPPVALDRVRLPTSAMTDQTLARLRDRLGGDGVRADHADRVAHAAGKGYPDLVRLRAGEPRGAPDAVAYPSGDEQLRPLLELCERESVAVVPFGGGTSVVGGVEPLRGEHRAVLALDTAQLDRLRSLDRDSRTALVGAGMRAPALERELGGAGLTLGHFPQSYEYVTIGGCAATRSAGQASTGYGSIASMIVGLTLVAPTGEISLPAMPATAAGPGLRQTLVGSEGTLGVISEVAVRVRELPDERRYEGVFFESFEAGAEALRALARERALPDVARLSDEAETRMSLALAGGGGVRGAAGRAYLRARGYLGGCLAIVGFEGSGAQVRRRRGRALRILRDHGGLPVGGSPGRAWLRSRFDGPYLRDDLLTLGVMVETLETATTWSSIGRLHEAVGAAIGRSLRDQGTPGLVMCHISHLYETGASLYFTFLARQAEDPIGQWRAVKRAAGDAILAGGGTITHHHAVGTDHLPWMEGEIGVAGMRALAALKAELDPRGIMNPGKLLAVSRG